MAKRYFNWKLAIVLLIGIGVLAVTAFALRQWQRTNRADKGLLLGNKAYDEHRWEDAARSYGRYLAINQNDVPVLMKYAEAQLKIRPATASNMTQALNAYRIVLRTDKSNSKAALRLAELYVGSRMPGEAELIISKFLENNPDADPELRLVLAQTLMAQRKDRQAAEQLTAVVKEHPDQVLAYEQLGYLTERMPDDFPDLPHGEQWFNEAVNSNSDSALAYIARAGFYRTKGSTKKTLADLEQAEKKDLSDPNDHLRLAEEFVYADMLDKAEQHLAAVQQVTPSSRRLWLVWAQYALKSDSKQKMREIAESGLKELSSEPWDFMPIAARLFIRADRHDRAAGLISKMNQKDIAPGQVAFLEGLLALEKEQTFEAVDYLRESIELGNNMPEAKLLLSQALSRLGDNKSALRHLRDLVSERPNLVKAHLSLARLLAQRRDWSESARHAAVAKQISPENVEAALLYHQAQMNLQTAISPGQNDQSLQDIEEQLSELEKTDQNPLQAKLLRFKLALQQDNLEDARALVDQIKKDFPLEIDTVVAEADLLVEQNNKDQAVSVLLESLKQFPQAVTPVRYLAMLLQQGGDREKCEDVIKQALERIESPVGRRELGLILTELYYRWAQKEKAYQLLDTLVRQMTRDIPLKRELLRCEQVLKDSERAQKLVDDIKALEGDEGWRWRYEQARIWFLSEDYESRYSQTVSLLQQNLQDNPNDQESRLLLASVYDRNGELQLAVSTYRQALNRSPNDLRVVLPAIDALSRAMEFDEVDRILNRVAQADIQNTRLQQFQFESYMRQRRWDSASDILRDFIRDYPNKLEYRISLAKLNIYQNRFEEAEKILDELKAEDPNSLTIADALVRLYLHQNEEKEALKICDEIVHNLNNAAAHIYRARICLTLNQTDNTLSDIERAAELEPENVNVWMQRSLIHGAMGLRDKAVADVQKALSLDSDNINVQKQAVALLLGSNDTDKVMQAKTILNHALKSNPDDVELLLYKARSLISEGTAPAFEKAEQILLSVTENKPEISRAWELLGKISLTQGQTGKAMEIAFRGLSHTPEDKDLLLLKARAEALRSPVLAVPTLRALLEAAPGSTQAILLLARIYVKTGENEKAVSILKSYLAGGAGDAEQRDVRAALAVALFENERDPDAQKQFHSLILSEDDNLTLVNIAANLSMLNDARSTEMAEDILRMVLRKNADSVEALTALAVLLHTSGRPDESVMLYRRVLQLEPDNKVAVNNLAWLLCQEKARYNEALELAQRGLKIFPNYTDLIDTRGVIYYKMGQFERAVEDFTSAIRLYLPGTPAAVGSHIYLAKTFVKLGQKDKALEYLNRALDLNQDLSPANRIGPSELTEAKQLLIKLQEGV